MAPAEEYSYYSLPSDVDAVIRIAERMDHKDIILGKVDPRRVASALVGHIRILQAEVADLKKKLEKPST